MNNKKINTKKQFSEEERNFFLACIFRQKATSYEIKSKGLTDLQRKEIYNLVVSEG